MSLDLLKEKFGYSVKKEADNKENIHEKLNDKFNSDGIENLKVELEEKERIIESLEIETSKLANEVLTLEKEKSTILGE